MNIVVFNKETKAITLADELKSSMLTREVEIITPRCTLKGLDWNKLDWDVTEDSLPEDLIDDSYGFPVYIKTQDQLSYTSCKLDVLKQEVKAIAQGKIDAIAPEWKQRNMLATGLALLNKGSENWTEEEQAVHTQLEAAWGTIAGIREASNLIEAELESDITYDYVNSELWG